MNEGVLAPAGPVSAAERLILIDATGIMLVVIVPVIVMTLGFAWWYRAGNPRARRDLEWAYSGHVELVTWSIPVMIVILVAGVGWLGAHALDPRAPVPGANDRPPLRVQVVSLDWKWLFILPDQHVATVNQLTVPVGTPLQFELTSATVMSAFFVPRLGSMIYTMPGMTTHLNLRADAAGAYPGLAAHYSGDGFSDMRFVVHAVSAADFARWVASAAGQGAAFDQAARTALEQPAIAQEATFRGVPEGAFEAMIDRAVQKGAIR